MLGDMVAQYAIIAHSPRYHSSRQINTIKGVTSEQIARTSEFQECVPISPTKSGRSQDDYVQDRVSHRIF